jgi:hypothetical protein
MNTNVPAQMFTANYRERFESDDPSNTVCVTGGGLDVFVIAPNGSAYMCEQLAAPQAPLTVTTRVINTKGLELEFRPGAGASFWIER